ncbi:regulation of nuclear pre-mRNA domain-containing protein 1B [Phlebotomus argentipes]|uniref:regulation of nuclear pre-mRNA domain-containing protein 1B n=1 Tax=Phlebotomus argentipes TaxID=94469 RepID=UPI002892B3B9|nr:regulation of nuclear pre-mRNA domain-containing protein 1B [Phlebotomus argentipes]
MSSFTETALVKKLTDLNPSQQSIQTLSLWLIHHRKHHVTIVKTWLRELQRAPGHKKLTFMYLANDVIQNSKKKGPEYGSEFSKALEAAFKHVADTCTKEGKTIGSLDRILNIWLERGVYGAEVIQAYQAALHSAPAAPAEEPPKKKRKSEEHGKSAKRPKPAAVEKPKEHVKSETVEVNGTVETHVTLSPHTPVGDPPEPEELIKALIEIENSASSDAAVRERIANLPAELSEVSMLSKIEDKEAAQKLSREVNDALNLLNEYNARLCTEMEDRKKLQNMLKDFQQEQRELLTQAESRLDEYTKKVTKMKEVQREIRNHLKNLPDLTQLPDVTGGLAPLPSAGDLFNIH